MKQNVLNFRRSPINRSTFLPRSPPKKTQLGVCASPNHIPQPHTWRPANSTGAMMTWAVCSMSGPSTPAATLLALPRIHAVTGSISSAPPPASGLCLRSTLPTPCPGVHGADRRLRHWLGHTASPRAVPAPIALAFAFTMLGRPHAVALQVTHRAQLPAALAPAGVHPCWVRAMKKATRLATGGFISFVNAGTRPAIH